MEKVTGTWLATLLIAVVMVATGCVFPMPPPSTPLTSGQAQQVLNCQEAIKTAGADFFGIKTQALERCIDRVLDAQVRFENGLISSTDYNTRLATARAYCASQYQAVGAASTVLVNKIRDKCGVYASTFLGANCTSPATGYDPLQFSYLYGGQLCGLGVGSAEDLGGLICGVKEAMVDLNVFLQVPRMASLLVILGPEFHTGTPITSSTIAPAIPLDSRCLFPSF